MFYQTGEDPTEILASSLLLITSVALNSAVRLLRHSFPALKYTEEKVINKEILKLEEELDKEEKEAESFLSSDTFVEYARRKRKIATRRKELEVLKSQNGKEQQVKSSKTVHAIKKNLSLVLNSNVS